MRWVFPLPLGVRYLLTGLSTLVLVFQLSVATTWARVEETRADLPLLTYPLSLTIVWYDNYNLLPKSFDRMKREVDRLFAEVGITVKWKDGKQVVAADVFADSLSVNVVLLPSDPKDWGLGKGVMGLATHRPGFKGAVYIFQPGIFRTLDLGCLGDVVRLPGAMVGLARAVGRVVTHEVIHFVAPQYRHTKSGLMKGSLNRYFLMRPGVQIDDMSTMALRTELAIKTVRMLAAARRGERERVVTTDAR